jgi:D-galactarolactone cycloisomerase
MIIMRVDIYPLMYPLKQPYGDANGYKGYRSSFLFKITTQSGLTGWGECIDWLPTLMKGFEGRIIPYLIGKQATNRQHIVQHIQKWHKRAGAAVSMALTEIVAKYAGLSICDLWGGKQRSSVPVYASFQSYTEVPDWIDHSVNLVSEAMAKGFNQFKVKVGGRTFREDQLHIREIQQIMLDHHRLIIDGNESYDLATARCWNQDFIAWGNILWFEEPLPMTQVANYKLLRSSLCVPIAGGENYKNVGEFLPMMCEAAIDIIQPDTMHEDGIDGYRLTLQLSRYYGFRASPHNFDGALSRLYALFAQACLPSWTKMDQQDIEPVEWDFMDNPFSLITPIELVDGGAIIPTGIGIGLEIDEQIIQKYMWDGSMYV